MATCASCKTQETELYENGVPACLKCIEARSIKRKPSLSEYEDIRATLHQELIRANDRKEVGTAHNRLNDFLTRGIVPEDLKAKTKKAAVA
jgi:hypothetical protein